MLDGAVFQRQSHRLLWLNLVAVRGGSVSISAVVVPGLDALVVTLLVGRRAIASCLRRGSCRSCAAGRCVVCGARASRSCVAGGSAGSSSRGRGAGVGRSSVRVALGFLSFSFAFALALGGKTRSFPKLLLSQKQPSAEVLVFCMSPSFYPCTKGSIHCIACFFFSFIWERATVALPLCAG